MKLTVVPGSYAVSRFAADAPLPTVDGSFFSVTRTGEELSIVCEEHAAPSGAQKVERGWACLKLEGPIAFSATGVIAALTKPLAEARIGVFVISTYDTDYILVKAENLAVATAALRDAGHEVA